MRCIAHRGFADSYPENTLRAVRGAVSDGADCIEVDARRCSTGEIVVIHDETVDSVTDGSGAVSELSQTHLQNCSVLGSGEGVPTLRAVFEALSPDVGINVELKETGIGPDVIDIAADFESDLLLSSFQTEALREARATSTDSSLAVLFRSNPDAALAPARELDCAAINAYWKRCTASFVERAHEAGFVVNAWTIDSTDAAKTVAAAGVDGLISNGPAYCRAVRDQRDSDGV